MTEKSYRIALVGCMRSGKDTAGKYLAEKLNATLSSFGEGIEDVIRDYFPEVKKGEKPRKHYQVIGQAFRKLNQDIWIDI